MVASKPKKPTEVAEDPKEVTDVQERVICEKCGKDIEITEGASPQKCPRCESTIECGGARPNKLIERIIKYDLLRRSKKYVVHFAVVLVGLAIAFNITGFFTGLFSNGFWWLALLSLPLVAVSYVFARVAMKKAVARRYKVLAWIVVGLNAFALACVVVTSVPYINELLMDALHG